MALMVKLVLLLYFLAGCDSAKILGFFPVPSISHQFVFRAITEELARRGHEVTVITTDVSPNPPAANFTEIDIHDLSYDLWRKLMNFQDMKAENLRPIHSFSLLWKHIVRIFDAEMSSPQVQSVLSLNKDHFDLLLVESTLPFAQHFQNYFNAPVVGLGSMTAMINLFEAVGVPTHPFLYADTFRDELVLDTFGKKINVIYDYIFFKHIYAQYLEAVDEIARKRFGKNIKSLTELEKKMDLLILNSNPLFTGIRPVGPNVIMLNSLHMKKTRKTIPEDLQQFLDNSSEGVIYFSLGTNALSKNFPPEIHQIFKDVFKQLPYKVLWKYELDEMDGKPDNVKIVKWAPQMDLLGHKNINLFITQCGQQSIDEAVHNKVPMVGLPVFGDQPTNGKRIVHHGLGVTLDLGKLTREDFLGAINEVIFNKSYKEGITKFSTLLQDQKEPPLETAIWWIEYVIRHKGAQHLRSPAAGISNWDYFMLDVITSMAAIVVIFILVVYVILRLLVTYIIGNKEKLKKS